MTLTSTITCMRVNQHASHLSIFACVRCTHENGWYIDILCNLWKHELRVMTNTELSSKSKVSCLITGSINKKITTMAIHESKLYYSKLMSIRKFTVNNHYIQSLLTTNS